MNKTLEIRYNLSHVPAIMLVALVLVLSACGFHLRNSGSVPNIYKHLQVKSSDSTLLTKWLRAELIGMRVQLDGANAPVLNVLAVRPTRQELVGSLTQIQIGLEVDFRIEDAQGKVLTDTRTITSYRNFQYNQNTVGIQSQQEELLQTDLYANAAQQVVRQLATGRLPITTQSAS